MDAYFESAIKLLLIYVMTFEKSFLEFLNREGVLDQVLSIFKQILSLVEVGTDVTSVQSFW